MLLMTHFVSRQTKREWNNMLQLYILIDLPERLNYADVKKINHQ
jgi:hypothetical protein